MEGETEKFGVVSPKHVKGFASVSPPFHLTLISAVLFWTISSSPSVTSRSGHRVNTWPRARHLGGHLGRISLPAGGFLQAWRPLVDGFPFMLLTAARPPASGELSASCAGPCAPWSGPSEGPTAATGTRAPGSAAWFLPWWLRFRLRPGSTPGA